jgi:transposase
LAQGHNERSLDGTVVRRAASKLSAVCADRLLAVADVLEGADPASVGLDYGVPGTTVARWLDILVKSGLEALSDLEMPLPHLAGVDPEIPASAVFVSFAGVERTALRAVAAACRGSTLSEIAEYHHVDLAEAGEWIAAYTLGGTAGVEQRFRPRRPEGWELDQAVIGRRMLPIGYSDRFLRALQLRATGDFSYRLLAITLAYEGRTASQIAASMSFEIHAIGSWIKNFIRSGLPGIAARGMQISWVPHRREFSATQVEELAAAAINEDYRRRLLVVADAYRGHTAAEIARRQGIAHWAVSTTVRAFEADGPEGLSTGKATETPPLRTDYSAARLREIASGVTDDDQCVRKIEALAKLYDGMSLMEAAKDTLTLSGMVAFVDRFLRWGHEIAHSYKSHIMTPTRPAPRKAPEVVPPIVMRKDLNAMRMDRVRGAYEEAAASRIDIVIDAYNRMSVAEIAQRRDWTVANVSRWLKVFNENGLDAIAAFKRKKKLPAETRRKIAPPVQSVIRRIGLSGDWNAKRIRDLAVRTVDEAYRFDLLVVANLYEAGGDTQRAARVSEVSEAEVERLAASFDLYGETFGQGMHRLRTLPPADDLSELKIACGAVEPLATYASVICAVYGGKRIGNIKTTFSLEDGELERIVEAYNLKRIQGLADDPLGVGQPMTWVTPSKPPAGHAVRERASAPPPTSRTELQIQPSAKPDASVKREYPGPHLTQGQKAGEKAAAKSAVIAMFEGKNSHRLEAVREFHRNRNLQAVARQFNVSPGTLENWLVAYVKTGMAERDRAASR